MHDSTRRERYTETEVEARLSDAGRILVALPWAGCFPCGFRRLWPETEVALSARRRAPSSFEIDAMDEAYAWTSFIADQEERRLVLMRSLMLPPAESGKARHVWTWGRLHRMTGMHQETLKKRWGRGIGRMVAGLNARPAAGGSTTRPRALTRVH